MPKNKKVTPGESAESLLAHRSLMRLEPSIPWAEKTVALASQLFKACSDYRHELGGRTFDNEADGIIAFRMSKFLSQVLFAIEPTNYREQVSSSIALSLQGWPDDFCDGWRELAGTSKAIALTVGGEWLLAGKIVIEQLGDQNHDQETSDYVKRWHKVGEYQWPELSQSILDRLAYAIREIRTQLEVVKLTPDPLEIKKRIFLNAESLGFKTVTFSDRTVDESPRLTEPAVDGDRTEATATTIEDEMPLTSREMIKHYLDEDSESRSDEFFLSRLRKAKKDRIATIPPDKRPYRFRRKDVEEVLVDTGLVWTDGNGEKNLANGAKNLANGANGAKSP